MNDQRFPNENDPTPTPEAQEPKTAGISPNDESEEIVPYYMHPSYQRAWQPTHKPWPKPSFEAKDTLFAYLSFLVGILMIRTLPITQNALGATLFIWLLFLFGAIYLRISGIRISRSATVYAVAVCLLGTGFVSGANTAVRTCLLFVILAAFLYWLYACCGLCGKHILGKDCLSHAARAIFVFPWRAVYYIFPALPCKTDKQSSAGKLMRTLLWCLAGLGIAIIPTVVIVALLSYDEQFRSLLGRIFTLSPKTVAEWIRDILLGVPVAMPLFGALFASKQRHRENDGDEEKLNKRSCHVLPKALLFAALTPILAVYVLFFASQWSYYVSAFTGVLPKGLTFASYARSGFFELCWVCAINAVMLLLFHLLMQKKKGESQLLTKIYATVISLFTLILIATALSKMLLYISSYGLTQKRVYASWLMLLLAVIFLLVLLKQFLPRLPLVGTAIVCAALFVAMIALPDVDGMIASYNTDAYLSGKHTEIDVELLTDYGASSVPSLIRLRDELTEKGALTTQENAILLQAKGGLAMIRVELEHTPTGFFSFHIPTERARSLLESQG